MIYYDKYISCFNIKSKHYWWKNINYTEKSVTKRLSQATNDFYNILGS
jgi:hypothetical protein